MIKDIKKYFKNEINFYANQEMLSYKEIFRGVVIKEWVVQKEE